ncbi:MAG: PqqD family protein [Clostridia bacterium]|nr:PqqD family protein [Clostridia bacterium]
MKIKSDIVVQKVGESYLAVAVGKRAEEISGMIKLNESAMLLWNTACERGLDTEPLAEALIKEYGLDKDSATKDAQTFIATLNEKGLTE